MSGTAENWTKTETKRKRVKTITFTMHFQHCTVFVASNAVIFRNSVISGRFNYHNDY